MNTSPINPEPLSFTHSGDVLLSRPAHAELRVELVDDDLADCAVRFKGETPINFAARRPHDKPLKVEATQLCAAIYWSRLRAKVTAPDVVEIVEL